MTFTPVPLPIAAAIITAVITSIIRPTIVEWMKTKFRSLRPEKDILGEAIKTDEKVDSQLSQLMEELKWDFNVAYDEKDAVGRRYRRQDALGTPFCITVDHQTVEDQTVTIRHRDTMKQERVKITDLKSIIENEVSMKNWLMKM